MRRTPFLGLAATALLAIGCAEAAPPATIVPCPLPAPDAGAVAVIAPVAAGGRTAEITLLYTSDEHGWLLPVVENGVVTGGAAEALGLLKSVEGHCAGDAAACPSPRTLLLSGGDNYTGPAISSYFAGESMADAMRAMGYSAMAFGNHELDFGRSAFVADRARTGAVYLAANVHASNPAIRAEMELPAFQIFERRGAKIGVVGLATDTTLTSAMASRFVGVAFEDEESALARAVPQAWAAGADAVVLIAHECPDRLVPILDRHPEWNLSFVGAGHCHKVIVTHAGSTPVISPGWRFERYVRAALTIDLDRPAGQRARAVRPELMPIAHVEGDSKSPIDAPLVAAEAVWQTKLSRALGEELGYTATGFGKESIEIARWIAGALRAELKTDVAIVNTGGIRQGLPKGVITKSTLWSILPFDNKLMIVRVKGRELIADLETPEAGFAGVERTTKGYRFESGKALDPGATYSVATIDFLYYGGSSFLFLKQDPTPKETGLDWRAPLVDWMRRQKTTARTPLEQRIDAVGGITAEAHH
ncbi:MAG: bifunctional UDP-sugar hydrolase/5'-nucleotidase [Byssovorax sp.]